MIVTLDAGHGGDDPGATAREPRLDMEIDERFLNWQFVIWLQRALERHGHHVHRTRDKAEQVMSLSDRAASAAESDCLISIHHNSCGTPWARGFEIFLHGDLAGPSHQLASAILAEARPALDRWGIPLRQPTIKRDVEWASRGRLTILAECPVPCCLLELCFLSNPLELIAAQDEWFREQLADAIARGIDRFAEMIFD